MPEATEIEVPNIKRPLILGVLISAEYTPTGALERPVDNPVVIHEFYYILRS